MNTDKTKNSFTEFFNSSSKTRWILFSTLIIAFAFMVYPPRGSWNYSYNIGDVALKNIKASSDFLVEDVQQTASKRSQAAEQVLTVYDYDESLAFQIGQQVQQAFDLIRMTIESSKESRTQQNLLKLPKSSIPETLTLHDQIWQMKPEFEKKLGIQVSANAFKILEKEEFSQDISDVIVKILTELLETGVVPNKELLLRESEKGIILRNIGAKTERAVYHLKPFYSLDEAKMMVRIIGKPLLKDFSYSLVNVIADLTQKLLQPNITLNRSETEDRKRKASEQVKPVFYTVKAGEMLLREGERITESQILKLRAMNVHRNEEKSIEKSAGAVLLIGCLTLIYYLHLRRHRRIGSNPNKDLLLMSSVLITFLLIPRLWIFLFESHTRMIPFSSLILCMPLAAAPMVVCLCIGIDAAVMLSLILAAGTAIILENRLEIFLYILLSGSMGAYWLQICKERKVVILAGVKLGGLNAVLAAGLTLYSGEIVGINFLWNMLLAFAGGIGSGILTAGIAPLIEMLFKYTTDITLLELANLEQPILKRLMLEAPGTYHHSVTIGSMVEAAASEIGANPLLAKVCGYYHDIGKIDKPLYFIENQCACENRHDRLAPSMSGLILISHVKEGVELAKKHKLGQVIIDTIRQHHGTSLIRYFYEKAKQLKGDETISEDDFRYPGPKPQTKEAGLVMLADIVEASSRTLENPTPSRIQGHVQKIINAVFSDGQLNDCELTLKDLNKIAKTFNKIMNGIHHHRIEYDNANGKEKKDGRCEPSKQPIDITKKREEKQRSVQLRRLGI